MADISELRRSGPATTFGPGAIVDFRDGDALVSAVVAGLEEWDSNFPPAGIGNPQVIHEERLERRLGKQGFRLPPVKEDDTDSRRLVAVRFPRWVQCPECNTIAADQDPVWASDDGRAGLWCTSCTHGPHRVWAVPVRFVTACERGHLADFPWHWWVHHTATCTNRNGALKLESKGAGLAGLVVACPVCGASNPMENAFSENSTKALTCRGHRPWLGSAAESCTERVRVAQRGAINLYYPVNASALSIPPWSDGLKDTLGVWWGAITNIQSPANRLQFIKNSEAGLQEILEQLRVDVDGLHAAIETRMALSSVDTLSDVRPEEYRQIIIGTEPPDRNFECRREPIPDSLLPYFSVIARLPRLREVRALKGFTRIHAPESLPPEKIASLSKADRSWLPAIEVRGEGIFAALNPAMLAAWEQRPEVVERYGVLLAEWHASALEQPPSIRFLLIHSLAHALMRQLILECGYSSASLRERLYVSEGEEGMCGLLIYTAVSDADGTLGGLQRQGRPQAFERTLRAAIRAIEWCSSDPLCVENVLAPPDSWSGAACHACTMAPETSCEHFNRKLDRVLLVGKQGAPVTGFFQNLLEH